MDGCVLEMGLLRDGFVEGSLTRDEFRADGVASEMDAFCGSISNEDSVPLKLGLKACIGIVYLDVTAD